MLRFRISRISVVGAAALLALTACSGTGGSSSSRTLNLAFYSDMVTVDPDVFYDIEGLAVSQSAYDGLLRYQPGTDKLEGDLATAWTVSPNELTYTFHLRKNAEFSDGTPVSSQAVERSFERRTKINQGPAYMLAGVAHYQTPDEDTFVVVLKNRVSDFLGLMASAWSPKIINPKVLSAHASDDAQNYLQTHAAGSGAFMLTSFQQGRQYVLKRNPHYWGKRPYFDTVVISIIPDVSTQLLELQAGGLDVILHGLPLSDLPSVRADHNLTVNTFPSLGTSTLYLNLHRPELRTVAVRRAIVDALNVPPLVKEIWQSTATVPSGAYPFPLLGSSQAPVSYPYDVAGIRAAIPRGLTLSVVYTPDSSGVQRRLADLVQQRLAVVGVQANVQQVQLSTVYGYRDHVQNAADIYLSTPTPDAAAPDAWGRIVWYTNGGLNFFNYSNKAVDAGLDKGLRENSLAAAAPDYGEAGRLATADWAVVPIAQVQDVMAMRADLTGVQHTAAYPWTLDLATLGRKS
jgi:peptide/nickel transport system substrate-binding protein